MGEKTRKKENPHKTYRRDALALAVGLMCSTKGCGFGYTHIAFVYDSVYNKIINNYAKE